MRLSNYAYDFASMFLIVHLSIRLFYAEKRLKIAEKIMREHNAKEWNRRRTPKDIQEKIDSETLCVWSKPLDNGKYLNYAHETHGIKRAVKGSHLCAECHIEDPYE